MRSRRWLFIALAVGLLLAGCGTEEAARPVQPHGEGFAFVVNPSAGEVRWIAYPDSGLALSGEGPRMLIPDQELALVDFAFEFLPEARLLIHAAFENVTPDRFFTLPFRFEVDDRTTNILSSTEPPVDQNHGLERDGVLSPGETTSTLTFEVIHRNRPFSYFVDAYALVVDADDPVIFEPHTTAAHPDGTTVTAGRSRVDGWFYPPDTVYTDAVALVRHLPDGSLDRAFGVGGLALSSQDPSGLLWGGTSMALQPDGATVVIASHHWDVAWYSPVVVRFHPDGSQHFRYYFTAGGQHNSASIVTVEPDGTVVIEGYMGFGPDYIFRVYPDGSTQLNAPPRSVELLLLTCEVVTNGCSSWSFDVRLGDAVHVWVRENRWDQDQGVFPPVSTLVHKPDGSSAELGDSAFAGWLWDGRIVASFVADLPGTYEVQATTDPIDFPDRSTATTSIEVAE